MHVDMQESSNVTNSYIGMTEGLNVWRDQEFVTKCTIKTSSGDDSDVQVKLGVNCTNASLYQETKGIVACLNEAKQFLIVKGDDPVVTNIFFLFHILDFRFLHN